MNAQERIAELETQLAQRDAWARLWKQAAKRRRTEDGNTLTAAYLAGRHDERKRRDGAGETLGIPSRANKGEIA